MPKYYAVTDAYGPLSLRLGECSSDVKAVAEYMLRASYKDSTGRDWIDSASTDVEDDLGIPGRPCMEEAAFTRLLLEAGLVECGVLSQSPRVILWKIGS